VKEEEIRKQFHEAERQLRVKHESDIECKKQQQLLLVNEESKARQLAHKLEREAHNAK
jgi:hypothetical protein